MTQNHGYPEDKVRPQRLTGPAYRRARIRGFMQGLELDDWLNPDGEAQGQRRAAT